MRRALRLLAAVVIGCGILAGPAYVALAVYQGSLNPRAYERVDPMLLVLYVLPLVILGLVVSVAGVLLCLTDLTLPAPTPRPAGRGPGSPCGWSRLFSSGGVSWARPRRTASRSASYG